eukprot:1585034-Alexandrium_andersonii.AAC.1
MISKTVPALPEKNRMFLSGTTQSDLLGPFELPEHSQVWTVPHKSKTGIYGPAMVECGGRIEGDDPSSDPCPKASDQ